MPVYSQSTVDEIEALLARNWTHRAISKKLAISRETIADLLRTRRKQRKEERKERRKEQRKKPVRREIKFRPIPPTRCPRCRAIIVTAPCVACYTRLVASPRPVPDLDE